MNLDEVQNLVNHLDPEERVKLNDGEYSFEELYKFKAIFYAALLSAWNKAGTNNPHKSIRFNNGDLCHGGDSFVVMAALPQGLITGYYPIDMWDYFNIPETECALYASDSQTTEDTFERLILFMKE